MQQAVISHGQGMQGWHRCCCQQQQQLQQQQQGTGVAAARALHQQHRRQLVIRSAVERDVDWDPAVRKGPLTAPPRSSPPPPSPPPLPPRQQQPAVPWYEVPFASRRNIMATLLLGTGAIWVWNKKVLPPVQVGEPPKDFPFKLAGYTDVMPSDFVYAKTPGGNWIAAALDENGRQYIIDQAGDLYYDTGNPDIGIYAVDTQGNLFNIYMENNRRHITPVGNISDMRKFKVSEIAGVKLDRQVNVVAMMDGTALPLPPTSGMVDANGKFVPPGEIVEGYTDLDSVEDNPFARLFGRSQADIRQQQPPMRYEVDPADPTPYDRQIFDQTLLDDPDVPGFQPLLPKNFSLEDFARQVEAEQQEKARRKGLF